MFIKSFALLSLFIAVGNVAADLQNKAKRNNEEINNVIYSMNDVNANVKNNIPMKVNRELSSTACEDEMFEFVFDEDFAEALFPYIGCAECPFCSGSENNYSCDFQNATPDLEAACDNLGGQFFQYSITGKGQGISISMKNMARCIPASCDKKADLKDIEEAFDFGGTYGKVSLTEESGASTLSLAPVAMMALTGVVATLL